MKKLLLLLSLAVLCTLTYAKKKPDYEKKWKLVTMNGVEIKEEITFRVAPNGSFIAKGLCNNSTGKLAFRDKKKFYCDPNIISTKKVCEEGMDAEFEFMATLLKADFYEIKKGVLTLKAGKQPTLLFIEVIEPKKSKKQIKAEEKEEERLAKEAEQKAKEAKKNR